MATSSSGSRPRAGSTSTRSRRSRAGRIWSGVDAAQLGLVDRLGGYAEASRDRAGEASIPANHQIELVSYPLDQSLFDLLFSDDGIVQAARASTPRAPRPARGA
jgi:ClpP class serine protease